MLVAGLRRALVECLHYTKTVARRLSGEMGKGRFGKERRKFPSVAVPKGRWRRNRRLGKKQKG